MNILSKLKGWRTLIVGILGGTPVILDAINAINLDAGVAEALASATISAITILRFFTDTPVGKSV